MLHCIILCIISVSISTHPPYDPPTHVIHPRLYFLLDKNIFDWFVWMQIVCLSFSSAVGAA